MRNILGGNDGRNVGSDGATDRCVFICMGASSAYLRSDGCGDAVVIGGRGEATLKDGMLHVMVSEKLGFIWVKILAGP